LKQKEFNMSRFQQLLKFFEKGGSGTDAELATLFAKGHEPKRGAEIVRSAICALNKSGQHICKRSVDGQRKREYYIPFSEQRLTITLNGVEYKLVPVRK